MDESEEESAAELVAKGIYVEGYSCPTCDNSRFATPVYFDGEHIRIYGCCFFVCHDEIISNRDTIECEVCSECSDCCSCNYCSRDHNTASDICDNCDRCVDDHCHCEICDSCRCRVSETISIAGTDYCEDCRDRHCSWCSDCEEYYEDDNGDRHEHGSDGIIGYHDVPDTIFWNGLDGPKAISSRGEYPPAPTDDPYLGIEIETEAVNCGASEIASIWNESGLGWSKSDGSLDDGVECVTHPYVFEALLDSNLVSTMNAMRKAGARAWDTSTCGLHIHVSRKAFKSRSHEWRFAAVHQRLAHELRELAGRGSGSYCRWTDQANSGSYGEDYTPATKIIAGKGYQYDRYMAINLENSGTIELRFWRGTTIAEAILGAAAIESAFFHWTKELTVRQLATGISWSRFIAWTAANRPLEHEAILTFCDLRSRHLNKSNDRRRLAESCA